jgi:hypothetical protein
MVCELKFKYGANYSEALPFKQLARYVHYETLDVYEKHSPKILGIIQNPNLAYATAIDTTLQATLQAAVAHHGTMANNPNLVPTLVNLSPQQFIAATANNPPTIDASIFVDPVGECLRSLELEFLAKSSKFFLQLVTFFRQKDETLEMLDKKLFELKDDT